MVKPWYYRGKSTRDSKFSIPAISLPRTSLSRVLFPCQMCNVSRNSRSVNSLFPALHVVNVLVLQNTQADHLLARPYME